MGEDLSNQIAEVKERIETIMVKLAAAKERENGGKPNKPVMEKILTFIHNDPVLAEAKLDLELIKKVLSCEISYEGLRKVVHSSEKTIN